MKNRKVISVLLCMVLTVVTVFSGVVSVSADSTITRGNVSYSHVTGNASDQPLPATVKTAYVGEKLYLNMQVDKSQKVASVTFYVDPPGSQGMTKIGSETAKNYLRYAYKDYTVKETGKYSYKMVIKFTNGKSKNLTGSFTVKKKNASIPENTDKYSKKVSDFVSDSRWKNGIKWNASQKPKLSPYSAWGCCAYVCDFAKYVFNKNSYKDGTKFTKVSAIKSGDIIQISGHWFVVLERSGNTLKTAEGNVNNGKVRISSTTYKIKDNCLYQGSTKLSMLAGFHMK